MRHLKDAVANLLHQSALQAQTDEHLLRAFAAAQDEAAFAELVRRYAHLVSGVCRNVLRDQHRTEDAFQAVFLVLARKAAGLAGRRLALGGWLYKVARRIALRARLNVLREQARVARSEAVRHPDAQTEVTWREVQRVLDEELDRLPEKFRVPFLLCFVEGRTQDEAAEHLGMPRGTFRLRLDAARALLQKRLTKRGIGLSVLAVLALKSSPVTAALVAETARAAVSSGTARPGAAALAAWALKPALSLGAAGAAAVAALLVGGALAAALVPGAPNVPPPAPPARTEEVRAPTVTDAAPDRAGALPLGVVGPDGRPVPGAAVTVLADHVARRGRYERHDRALVGDRADGAGRFRLDVPTDFQTWSPEARPVKVFVRAPGAPPVGVEIGDFWDGLPRQEVRLPGPAEVRGRVLAGGRPVAGATVRVVRVGAVLRDDPDGAADRLPGWPEPVRTDAAGAFVLPDLEPAGGVTVAVRADGFCAQFANAPANANAKGWDVRLFPGRPYRGRVVADDTGLPLAGCDVSLRSASPVTPYLTARTGPDGRFEADAGGDARRFTYRLYPPTDVPYPAVSGDAPEEVGAGEVEFRVPRGALVNGIVRVQGTGAPVPGARVLAAPVAVVARGPVPIYGPDGMVVTGPDGRFRVPVSAGTAALVAFGPDNEYVCRPFEWSEPNGGREVSVHAVAPLAPPAGTDPREVTFELRRGGTARGEVTGPDGTPLARGMLVCRSLASVVVPVRDGRFALPGREPGREYPVAVLGADGAAGAVAVVRVGDRATAVRLRPCGSATVRFVDPDGKPVSGHQPRVALCLPVEGEPGDAGPARQVTTLLPPAVFSARQKLAAAPADGAGRSELTGLIPGAVHEVYRVTGGGVVADAKFVPKPGERLALPDVVLRRP